MADIAVPSPLAGVKPLLGTVIKPIQCAEVVDVGEPVYLNSSGKVALADADAYATAKVIGVVGAIGAYGKTTSVADEFVDVVLFGPIAGFASLTPGGELFASVQVGRIADATPAGASGDFRFFIGWVLAADVIFVNPFTDEIAAL